ncbi:MAG TPA: response regulator transcription factor [Candidatus Margulisiibacteriota bacterium]|nr:response regulator transcription factor [Candidatus Margulisiibacteriota bacterium]
MAAPLRIVVADDHALFRQGLKSLLKLQADVTIVGEAARIDELTSLLTTVACDVVLLDLGMERNSLVDIAALAERARVVVVTASEQPEDAVEAIRLGACAVVFKRFAVDTLMDAIRAAAQGQVWMPPSLQAHIAAALRETARNPLTPREREIIRQVALGLRNAEVATKLFISEQTVKTHLNNIFQKLGIRDRVELTLYAARVGIIGIHERPR